MLLLLFVHFTSHEPHISVHFRLCFLRVQLIVMQIPLHPHLINCSTALGAGGSVVGTGCSLSPSCCHPCNIGLGMLGFGLSKDFQTNATRLALLVIWCRTALVGGQLLIYVLFLAKEQPSDLSLWLLAVSIGCTTRRQSALASCIYHLGWCRWFPGWKRHRVLIVQVSLVYSSKTLCFFH